MMLNSEVEKPDDATLIVRRLLKASPELAFEAWTSEEHIQNWMCAKPGMVIPQVRMDLQVGGKFRIQMKMEDGEYFTAVGVFREVKVPTCLVYTWAWEKDGGGEEFGEVEEPETLVTVEFIKRDERTELILTHSRFATVKSRDSHAEGWDKITVSFAVFLEKE